MNTKQLYNDILTMGFDRRATDAESDFARIFETAVNRAQETLAAFFPLYTDVAIYANESQPLLCVEEHHLKASRVREWKVEGCKSYAFSARGEGTVTVVRENLTHARHTVTSPIKEERFLGAWDTPCTLTIRAETRGGEMTLHDLYAFAERENGFVRQGGELLLPLSALDSHALSLDTPPKNERGENLIEGRDYRVQNGTLYLPSQTRGQLYLTVTRAPRRFDLASDAPDVRAEALALLPLLVASYAWLDDDREKALYYLALYRESLSRLRTSGRCAGVGYASYDTSNGW